MKKKFFKWWKRWNSLLLFSSMVLLIIAFAVLGVVKFRNEAGHSVSVSEYNSAVFYFYLLGWDAGKSNSYSTDIVSEVLKRYETKEKFVKSVNEDSELHKSNKKIIIETFEFLYRDYYTSRKK